MTCIPITKDEATAKGWNKLDVVLFSGDAYIDHPAFGTAIIARILEKAGYKVAIVPQPNWKDDLRDFKKFGKPRLFFGVSAGSMDSMVNHYTANKRLRSDDAYTPGGKSGFRPDYATVVYSNILKQLYPESLVVIGGVEASMRRFAHYDYWQDTIKPSILIESKADIGIYGMGEKTILEIAHAVRDSKSLDEIKKINQIFYINNQALKEVKELYPFDTCRKDKIKFAENAAIIDTESNRYQSNTLIQKHGEVYVVVNTSNLPISQKELDAVYELPFTRKPHPKYLKRGDIPAFEMIKNSITIHRGCFGGCAFCAINNHQGKHVSSRSENSILKELNTVANDKSFTGTITDLGGPSANMYQMGGKDLNICKKCCKFSCIYPNICKNLNRDHFPLIQLYEKALKIKNVKKLFIGSGIRYDIILADLEQGQKNIEYLRKVMKNHVSGWFKVAPEHSTERVLKLMRKPDFKYFKSLIKIFNEENAKYNKKQIIVPYMISSHPGCKTEDMVKLACELKELNLRPEHIQDFTPTPMTLSAAMYYTGIDPYTKNLVYVAKSHDEKKAQRKYFFWHNKEYKQDIISELKRMKMFDELKKLYN